MEYNIHLEFYLEEQDGGIRNEARILSIAGGMETIPIRKYQ